MKSIKLGLILGIVTLFSSSLLYFVHNLTAPILAEQNNNQDFSELIVGDSYDELTDASTSDNIEKIYEVKKDNVVVGYIYDVVVTGFEDEINFLIGVEDNQFTKLKVVKASNAEWFGKIFADELANATINQDINDVEIDAIAGQTASISSGAIMDGLKEVIRDYEESN